MATRSPAVKSSVTQNGKTIYLTNKEMLAELKRCKKKGQMSDMLARMLQLLCSRYAKKGNFINYSYNEDMQGYAMMMLVRTWNSFDPDKSSNPFAFFTQCIKNSFIQYLNQERKQRDVRDLMLIDQGLNPSYGYDDGDGRSGIQDESEFETIRSTAEFVEKTTKYTDAPIERDEKGTEIETFEEFTEDAEIAEEAPE